MKKLDTLYFNAFFHTLREETERFLYLGVSNGKIAYLGNERPVCGARREADLNGLHAYPMLIDSHLHLLASVAVAAGGFFACEIRDGRVEPATLKGVGERVKEARKAVDPRALLVGYNCISSALPEKRLPNRFELDEWTNGERALIYNIDWHSCSLSTALLKEIGGFDEASDGILAGLASEEAQGVLSALIAKEITPALLLKGVARFQNDCARFGIGLVCALEGSGERDGDGMVRRIAHIAQRMDIGVRLFLQFTDPKCAEPFRALQRRPRIGGCGMWEMDGAIGSHSAAFYAPYGDNGHMADCYYPQSEVDALVKRAHAAGYYVSAHAIGDKAIDCLTDAFSQLPPETPRRIDHFEFPSPRAVEAANENLAVAIQPGYAWLDERYMKSYEQYLQKKTVDAQLPLRMLYDKGVLVCGSSDAPIQSVDPFLQMLGMADFHTKEQRITPYEALRCYTANPARMLGEEKELGTLETGKRACFFVSRTDLTASGTEAFQSARCEMLYLDGKPYREKSGSFWEFAATMLRKKKLI